jgi:hypothetical protein
VDKTGELAEPASQVRYHASGSKFPAFGEPFRAGSPSKLLPKAEHFPGRNLNAVQQPAGGPQVLNLPGGERKFRFRNLCPEWRSLFSGYGGRAEKAATGMGLHVRAQIPPPPMGNEESGLDEEGERLQPIWLLMLYFQMSLHMAPSGGTDALLRMRARGTFKSFK